MLHPGFYVPTSTSANLLTVPRTKLVFSSRAFRVCAPTVWNSFENTIRESQTFSTFKRHLKTHLFHTAFNIIL